jgi:hypothetical protein
MIQVYIPCTGLRKLKGIAYAPYVGAIKISLSPEEIAEGCIGFYLAFNTPEAAKAAFPEATECVAMQVYEDQLEKALQPTFPEDEED